MDIEKMQKINKLSRELLQHGVVSDMEEATKQAENMVNKNDRSISDVMNLKRSTSSAVQPSVLNETSFTDSNQSSQPQQQQQEGPDVTIELRKLAYALQEQSKTITGLKQQLDQLRDDMSRLKGMRPMTPVQAAPIMRGPGEPQTHLKKDEVQKPAPHPKVGNYNPDEVTIEKFFYSGPPK